MVVNRVSLQQLSAEKKAKKVKFFRNGDKYFKGVIYHLMTEKIRTFDALLDDLNNILIDQVSLPKGVRVIFTLDGKEKIRSLDHLLSGHSYVASSSEAFVPLDYESISGVICFDTKVTKSSPLLSSASNNMISSRYSTDSTGRGSPATSNQRRADSAKSSSTSSSVGRNLPATKVNVISHKSSAPSSSNALRERGEVPSSCSSMSITSSQLSTTSATGKALPTKRYNHNLLQSRATRKLNPTQANGVAKALLPATCSRIPSPVIARATPSPGKNSIYSSTKPGIGTDITSVPCVSQRNHLQKAEKNDAERVGKASSHQSATEGVAKKKILLSKGKQVKQENKNGNGKVINGHSHKVDITLESNQEKAKAKEEIVPSVALEKLEIPKEVLASYKVGQVIGDGNFAVVHECIKRQTKEHFALKIIDKIKCEGREFMIANEVSILRRVNHPNIISLVEVFDYYNELYLVTELVTGGDLFDAIAEANKYSEEDASFMMKDLCSALEYLHSINICHRDIKPENLLVCDAFSPRKKRDSDRRPIHSLKLADFGLAIQLPPGNKLYDVCGTPNYVAPEILSESGYDHTVDVWAAGVIAYVLLCGYPPFVSPDNDQDKLFDQILSGKFDFPSPDWDDVSFEAKHLIIHMLQVNSDSRYSAKDVLSHPWVSSGNTLSSSISSQTVGATTTRLSKLNLETLDKKRSPVSCDVISGSLVSSCSSSSGVEDAYSQSTNDSGTGTGSPSTATTCTAEESVAIVQSSPNEMKHSQQSSQMVTSHLYSL